jgi:hypothetical protein
VVGLVSWIGVDPDEPGKFHVQAGFFSHLPHCGLGDALPEILHPARQGPVPAVGAGMRPFEITQRDPGLDPQIRELIGHEATGLGLTLLQ